MVTQDRPLRRRWTTGAYAAPDLPERVFAANTAAEAFAQAQAADVALGDAVALAARETAMRVVAGRGIAVETVLFDRDGRLTGHAPFASHHATPPRNLRR